MSNKVQKKPPHTIQFAIVYNKDIKPHATATTVAFFQSPSFTECIKEWKRNSDFAVKHGYRIVVMENNKYVADIHLQGWMFHNI